jgi:hypothetical protein
MQFVFDNICQMVHYDGGAEGLSEQAMMQRKRCELDEIEVRKKADQASKFFQACFSTSLNILPFWNR